MGNFKLDEYNKDYIAIRKEYIRDLKQITESKEVNGKLESIVLLNGGEYKKIEYMTNDKKNILFMPNENLQTLPIIKFIETKDFISLEIHKITDKNLLEYTSYFSVFKEGNEVLAKLETKYFDVSEELNNGRNILKYGVEIELEKGITKKLVSKSNVFAKRNDKYTLYYDAASKATSTKETMPLFELLSSINKQVLENNKTK